MQDSKYLIEQCKNMTERIKDENVKANAKGQVEFYEIWWNIDETSSKCMIAFSNELKSWSGNTSVKDGTLQKDFLMSRNCTMMT